MWADLQRCTELHACSKLHHWLASAPNRNKLYSAAFNVKPCLTFKKQLKTSFINCIKVIFYQTEISQDNFSWLRRISLEFFHTEPKPQEEQKKTQLVTWNEVECVFLHVETQALTSCSWLLIWSSVCRSSSSLAMMASILSASSRAASCSALLLSSSNLTALSSCSRSSAGHRRNLNHSILLIFIRAPHVSSECFGICLKQHKVSQWHKNWM